MTPSCSSILVPMLYPCDFLSIKLKDLSVLDWLRSPIWICDLVEQRLWWANQAALSLSGATQFEELTQEECQAFVRSLLLDSNPNLEQVQLGQCTSEPWYFYAFRISQAFHCIGCGIELDNGHRGILIEGTPEAQLEVDEKNNSILQNGRKNRYSPQNGLVNPASPPFGGLGGFLNEHTPLKRTEQALRQSEERYRLLAENVSDLISRHNQDGIFEDVTWACQSLLGYQPEEMIGRSVEAFCHSDERPLLQQFYHQVQHQSVFDVLIHRFRHRRGHYLWFETNVKVIPNADTGEIQEIICVSRDITKRKQTENALKQAEAQYRNIFDNITQGIFQTTLEGCYLKANRALAQLYGYESPEDLMQHLTDIQGQLYSDPRRRERLIELLHEQGEVLNFESQVYRQDGSMIWISENVRTVGDEAGNVLYYEGTVEDITYRRHTEEKLLHQAYFDALTGLPNREWFQLQLKEAIALCALREYYHFAVLFIDLDSFKVVNDSLGHLAGDKLLTCAASRLKDSLRTEDKIARFGGDEFAILLDDIQSVEEAIAIAERLLIRLRQPFPLFHVSVFSSASIGITVSSIGYERSDEVLRDADVAMYQAKAKGKDRYMVFTRAMQEAALTRLQVENDLREALVSQQLCLHYQPIVDLKDGRLTGFEALIRWQHPTRGWISPVEFIPIAEETGLINAIGTWVLQQACQQLKTWQQQYPQAVDLSINVNLSAQQLKQAGLVEQIAHLLLETGLNGKKLKLEITESCFLETVATEFQSVKKLKDLGIGLCIDDFGTGYSSLSRLHEFPIDTLKIDRSFIRQMGASQTAIVQIIVTLAHTLGMNVVAEGIETQQQLVQLQALGCELGQGYFFARPLDSAAATEVIRCPRNPFS